jgi:hypothetical protein
MLRALLILTAVCIVTPVVAQDMTAEQRAACKGDYEKYCNGVMPGGGRIIACLSKAGDKLTDACKKILASAKPK